jgi:hypothetical protein
MARKRAQDLHVGRSIERIVVVDKDEHGDVTTKTIHKKRRKSRKASRALRHQEEQARLTVEAHRVFADEYLARHKRSNRRRPDGWLFDLDENLYKAAKKAMRHYEEEEDLIDDDLDDEDEDEDDED